MSTSSTDGYRRDFFRDWPFARELDRALANDGNPKPLFYFARAQDHDLARCAWALGRLGTDLEKRFGILSEVLILFIPYEDLQRRTYNALTQRLRHEVSQQQLEQYGEIRFTPDSNLSLLYSPDPRVVEKVEAWNAEDTTSLVAPIANTQNESTQLRSNLVESLFSVLSERDLYQGRNPVTGYHFFGRTEKLNSFHSAFRDGHSIGLFGLRRSGKTSLLKEFKKRYKKQRFAVVISDLEATTNLSELPEHVSAYISSTLHELKAEDPTVWIGSPNEQNAKDFSRLGTRIRKVAEKNSQYRFVFAFDEVESLVPLLKIEPMEVRAFLGAIRGAAQSSDNVSLLLTGVTSKFFSNGMLDPDLGIENPMFGFVEEQYLGPFNEYETANLIQKLGRGMMLEWEEEALTRVRTTTGGFPFLVRDLASATRRTALESREIHIGTDNITIDVEIVNKAIAQWRTSAASLWEQIVQTLERHHELMANMVKSKTDEDLALWLQLGDDSDRAARSLEGLGLLERSEDKWRLSEALRSLQQLSVSSDIDIDAVRQQQSKVSDLKRLVEQGEGHGLEFKATAKKNLHTGKSDDAIKHSFVKAVAGFLNAQGGTLLIGVSDGGEFDGVDADMELFEFSEDKYARYLRDSLRNILGESVFPSFVDVCFLSISSKIVCKIDVRSYPEGVWFKVGKDETFFVRSGNQTISVPNSRVNYYLKNRGI